MNKDEKTLIIESSRHIFDIRLKELWQYRELLYFLIWRDIKVKYKQSILGFGWAIFQPVMSMIVFTLVFGKLAKMPSGGVPYPLFTLAGVVIWTYFSSAVIDGTGSLIRNSNLISKVYFPRLIIPLAAVGRGLFDFIIALIILIFAMIYYGCLPKVYFFCSFLFIILTFLIASGVSLWSSAISVKYRDLPYAIPFIVQMVFWLTPVAYGSQVIPEQYSFLYSLNPMYSVIEGFRWSLLDTQLPSFLQMGISVCMAMLFFMSGLIYFRKMDRQFADVI